MKARISLLLKAIWTLIQTVKAIKRLLWVTYVFWVWVILTSLLISQNVQNVFKAKNKINNCQSVQCWPCYLDSRGESHFSKESTKWNRDDWILSWSNPSLVPGSNTILFGGSRSEKVEKHETTLGSEMVPSPLCHWLVELQRRLALVSHSLASAVAQQPLVPWPACQQFSE